MAPPVFWFFSRIFSTLCALATRANGKSGLNSQRNTMGTIFPQLVCVIDSRQPTVTIAPEGVVIDCAEEILKSKG